MRKYTYIFSIIIIPCIFSFLLCYGERLILRNLVYMPCLAGYINALITGILVGIFYIVILKISKMIFYEFKRGFYINVIGLLAYPIICVISTVIMAGFEVTLNLNDQVSQLFNMTFVLGWQYSLKGIVSLILLYIYLYHKKYKDLKAKS
ncbi:MAG: hypothetical protein AB9836_02445 [Aminipila sp.]